MEIVCGFAIFRFYRFCDFTIFGFAGCRFRVLPVAGLLRLSLLGYYCISIIYTITITIIPFMISSYSHYLDQVL